jgi:hypothetical protein
MELLPTVYAILSITPSRWASLAESIPAELLSRRPAPEEWSAVECLVHIMDTEMVFKIRLAAFLEGCDFPGYNPDLQKSRFSAGQSPQELVEEFGRMRQESLASLHSLASSDLERHARHAELGMVSLEMMVNEWAGHDLMHTVQAERALMQPFIQGCGPWQVYFTDHIVKAV